VKYYIVVLYGCETWSLAIREEHRLRVLQNTVLRRILEANREKVTGGWKRLHNEEFHQIKCDEMGGSYSTHRGDEEVSKIFCR